MTMKEAMEWALANAPRNASGDVDEEVLRDHVKQKLDPSEKFVDDAIKRAIAQRKRPGTTPSDGQLVFEGLEAWAYEPNRLVADDDKHVIEQRNAKPHHIQARADRTQRNAERQAKAATRDQQQASRYSLWAMRQFEARRAATEITYDAFVREAGHWSPGSAEPEDIGDDA